MLTVTDASLSAINPAIAPEGTIRKYYEALLALGVDYAEVSPAVLPHLGSCFDPSRVIIRNDFSLSRDGDIIAEITANTLSANRGKIPGLYLCYDELRIIGAESLLLSDYLRIFPEILENASLPVSFSTKNAGYAATALMIEWVLSGGDRIVCAFMGTGGHAPLEEALLALQVNGYPLSNIDPVRLKPLGALWQQISGRAIPDKKPVVGEKIFEVESGIHIDGIIKNSLNYEPFSPEKVGAERRFVLGKSSGKKALLMKLKELNLNINTADLDRILRLIRQKSMEESRSISDTEFCSLIRRLSGVGTCT
ncbi:MAG TPA: hypothetical protein VN381_05385 [Anaerovoracaceae bacterium]|nr:hypothetical protein [Anaerovoracaceae bacterium]